MTALLLAGLALADADAHAAWTDGIDKVLDQAMVEFGPCVAYTEAVEAGHVDLLVFELEMAGKRATPTLKFMSMNEPSMTPCFLRVLRKQAYSAPPNGESAFVFIEIANLVPRRGAPAVFRDSNPATGEQSALPLTYLVQTVAKVQLEWAKACIEPIVKRQASDVGARVRMTLSLLHDGSLAVEPIGASVMPDVEACVLKEAAKLRLPAGFAETGKLRLVVGLTGTGGEYADEEQRWNRQWSGRIVTWLDWYDRRYPYDPRDPAHLLLSAEWRQVASREELAGCLVKWPADPGLVLTGETRHDGRGDTSTLIRPGGNLAVCVGKVLDGAPGLAAAEPLDVTFWMQVLPEQRWSIAPPAIEGVEAHWGPRQVDFGSRSLVLGPTDYFVVHDRLRTARRAIESCRRPPPRWSGASEEVLVDARFDGATGKVIEARLLEASVEESVEACVLAAAKSKGLDEPLGTGELRVIYTATLPERE
ncbi:MAG: hypothetical protein FJ102_08640 [Deltaproteobacteria bacterium]|nr:hypothetical protein [Deltaproteobacteria bacterium]